MLASLLIPLVVAMPAKEPVKSFLVMGDWGSGYKGQKHVASAMNKVAEKHDSECVMAIGDNFYFTGVQSTSDYKWKAYWKSIYKGRLAEIPWYAVLGNHDWYGNPKAQLEYHEVDSQWNMPDHFYVKTTSIGSSSIAFIFIDSDLMYYGLDGWSIERPNFSKLGWTRETLELQFQWVEQQLQAYSNSDYLFVMGHHNAVICGSPNSMPRLVELLEKYRVSAYFFGHQHFLGYSRQNGVDYVLTGAGGKSESACGGADWSKGNIYGFVNLMVRESKYTLQFIDQTGKIIHKESGLPREVKPLSPLQISL